MNVDNIVLSAEEIEIINDLKIQAMLFGMLVDWETLGLVPKSSHTDAVWLTRWKNKRDDSDNLPESPEQAAWDE